MRSLGFGGDQDVGEQEEVPVLRLHPRLELNVRVEEERPVRVDEEGLDQRARVWAHGRQEALPGAHVGKTFSVKAFQCFCLNSMDFLSSDRDLVTLNSICFDQRAHPRIEGTSVDTFHLRRQR